MSNGRIFHLGAGRGLKRVERDLFGRQGCAQVGLPQPPNRNIKNKGFVDTVISIVLRDLPFSRNKSLKSADD